jgi:hypothetical protein
MQRLEFALISAEKGRMWAMPTQTLPARLIALCAGLVTLLTAAIVTPVHAQSLMQSLMSSGQSGGGTASTRPGNPGASLASPNGGLSAPKTMQSPLKIPPAPAMPSAAPPPAVAPGTQVALYLAARFGPEAPHISGGLIWRVYADKPDAAGVFELVREEHTAAPAFVLPSGGYIVHVTFGQASATKHIALRSETVREVFDLRAGGLRIEGRVGDVKIPAGQISFDVFKGSQFDVGDKVAMAQGAMTGEVILLPEGTYTIVSNYGDGNAVVRSDIRVKTAQLTDVTVTHRAAVITIKLVASKNGEALANTAWSVLTPGGDVIKESIGAFPRVVLAEGEYRAIARNEGKVFEREFKVITGVDSEIAVLAR